MKVMCVQFVGNEKFCVMNTGSRIPMSSIIGEASVGKTVELVNDRYTVTSGAAEECEH